MDVVAATGPDSLILRMTTNRSLRKRTRSVRQRVPAPVAAIPEAFVFGTTRLRHYEFPTHINDLVVDRADASCSEVFIVVIHPSKAPPLHQHDDTEQIFYVLQGHGTLTIGKERRQFPVSPGDVVRVPPRTLHSIRAGGNTDLKYLCVDCFGGQRAADEPTWDDHVKTLCRQQGWDYAQVVARGIRGAAAPAGRVSDRDPSARVGIRSRRSRCFR
jgi:mannose-6-phosphate isomerase-like protein (cupin superfamily)